MKMSNILMNAAILVAACVCSVTALGQEAAGIPAASEGNAMAFLVKNTDPLSLSMAGADIASGQTTASSIFGNPAATCLSGKKLDVAASYSSWQPHGVSTGVTDFGVATVFGRFGLSAGVSYGLGDGYDIISAEGDRTGKFNPSEVVIGAGLSYRLTDFVSAGMNLKFAAEKIAAGNSHKVFAADIFVMAELEDFRFTAGARNVGSKVKSASGEKYRIPSAITVGASYGHVFGEKHDFLASIEGDCHFGGGAAESLGLSYTYNGLVSIRAGYRNVSGKAPGASFASFGAGIRFFGIRLDAAYLVASSSSPLRNTFSVGMGYSF